MIKTRRSVLLLSAGHCHVGRKATLALAGRPWKTIASLLAIWAEKVAQGGFDQQVATTE